MWWKLENAGDYINKYSDPKKSVEQIKSETNFLVSILGKPKHILLSDGFSKEENGFVPASIKTWVKSPDGTLKEYKNDNDATGISVFVPAGEEKKEGIYLAASIIEAGVKDVE